MNIEIAARKAKRRAKTQAWLERTGKQKPIKGELQGHEKPFIGKAYLDGQYIGEVSRDSIEREQEGGAA